MRLPDAMHAVPRLLLLLAATLAASFALVPATATADYKELLKDACRDEKVDGTYSQKDYREALDNIPADADQYTNCRDVLRSAQLAAASAEGGSAGSSGSGGGGVPSDSSAALLAAGGDPLATATPEEKAAVTKAISEGSAPVTIGGEIVEPSTLGAGRTVAATVSDLPPPLLAALALLALCAVALLVLVALPRVRARRNA